jgi:hypothetical protein
MRLQEGFASGEMGFPVNLHGSDPGTFMSALGQKQTRRNQMEMSAFPPKADIRERVLDVRSATL